jgi:predicted metal-dependent phosphoesterase TrpH
MHTKYSDGQFEVKDLLNILNEKQIKYASITDHNSIGAHLEIRENNLYELYNGIMITGVEIQTLVDGYLIEVLVYNYDIDKFKKFMDDGRNKFWEFHHRAYKELLNIADNLGLKYIEPDRELQNGYYCNMKFQDAIHACREYNKNIIDEKILDDHLYFYRNEFQRPGSLFFVDNTESFPKLEDVINEAHNSGALVFLAHIDEYKAINDKMLFLENLINNYNIDGIECYHPSIDTDRRTLYIKFANDNDLLISAGSDFHGSHLPHRTGIKTIATLNDISWL